MNTSIRMLRSKSRNVSCRAVWHMYLLNSSKFWSALHAFAILLSYHKCVLRAAPPFTLVSFYHHHHHHYLLLLLRPIGDSAYVFLFFFYFIWDSTMTLISLETFGIELLMDGRHRDLSRACHSAVFYCLYMMVRFHQSKSLSNFTLI